MSRVLPAALQTHIETGEASLAWLFKITREDGTILGFTTHDSPITFNSVTYQANTGFVGSEMNSSLGLSVDNIDGSGAISSAEITEADLKAGVYDNAKIEVFIYGWNSAIADGALFKTGFLGNAKRSEISWNAEVRGLGSILQQSRGRTVQYVCDRQLGDTKCGVTLATFQFNGSVSTVNIDEVRLTGPITGFSDDDGYFSRGTIEFTSGALNGRTYPVKSNEASGANQIITLWEPTGASFSVSDTFQLTAGCDKYYETCRDKFSNLANFRGFHHIPGSDRLVQYIDGEDLILDGSSLFN